MRVVFAGTPEFARVALQVVLAADFDVPLVLTQPDRAAGRGMRAQASPVKQCALQHGIALAQPHGLRLDGKYPQEAATARQAVLAAHADVMVVAAYGLLLPQWLLAAPRHGCLNIHASLLPRWRGAAPMQRAIEAGDAETGVTIMQMDEGLDTGAMLLREALPIADDDTAATLHDKLATLGAELIVRALKELEQGELDATAQPEVGVTHAGKIDKSEGVIDWSRPAAVIARQVRAFDPFPGSHTTHGGSIIKVWGSKNHSEQRTSGARYGQILAIDDDGVRVACGGGSVLVLTLLQRAGGKRLGAADFLRGFALAPGEVLGESGA